MRPTILALLLTSLAAFAQEAPQDARGWLNRGVQAYKTGRYVEAVEAFQRSVDLDPTNATSRLYLATAHMSQYIPGGDSAENLAQANAAKAEFERVLALDPANTTAMKSLASLAFEEAQGVTQEAKLQKLDEAARWYQKLVAAEPRDKEGWYSLGVIAWGKFYPAWQKARADLDMKPEDRGPLRYAVVRQDLLSQYGAIIEDGILDLQRALDIDPQYDDAMAYMNLLIRERADLRDTPEEWRRDTAAADAWVQKALETKKMKAAAGLAASEHSNAPPPQRIRVGAGIEAEKLIRQVQPVYPALARQARVQGTVRFTAVIGKDGTIQNLQLISGHPLLVQAAHEALNQWVYRPTLLNGEPVEVVTEINVNFALADR